MIGWTYILVCGGALVLGLIIFGLQRFDEATQEIDW